MQILKALCRHRNIVGQSKNEQTQRGRNTGGQLRYEGGQCIADSGAVLSGFISGILNGIRQEKTLCYIADISKGCLQDQKSTADHENRTDKINAHLDQRADHTADHKNLQLAELVDKFSCLHLCKDDRDQGNHDWNGHDQTAAEMIIGNQQSYRTAGLKAGGNDSTEQQKHQILVGFDAGPHVLQRIFFGFLGIYIGQRRVVLLYASAQRKHHEEKGNGRSQRDLADADADILADRYGPEHSGSDGGDGVNDRLGLQNGVALVGIVGQRNDHGLHRYFH